MLEQVAHFNDLSPKLRKKLDDRIKSYGTEVKYRFAIDSENPDPEKYNGKRVWPSRYTLDPIVFDIVDPEEERDNKSRAKKIGIVIGMDEKGIPNKFGRIRVLGKDEGIKTLDLTKPEDIAEAMALELHPKFNGGFFQDKKRVPIVSRIDDEKEAIENRNSRQMRRNAIMAVGKMSDGEIKDFAAAMNWDELMKTAILRDKLEQLAEETPDMVMDLVESDKLKYQSVIKKAKTKGVISHDPVGNKWLWGANQQVITVLGMADSSKNEIEQLAEFIMTNGQKGEEIFKKIESLNSTKS